jgi:hypothetical protein
VTDNVIGFIPVHDQNWRLTYSLFAAADTLGLNISHCRDQGYDNRENVKDKRSLLNNKCNDTGWGCRVECAKAIRYQTRNIRDAWFEVAEISYDSQVESEAQFQINYELQNFEFLVAIVVWYDIMFAVCTVSKQFNPAKCKMTWLSPKSQD